MKSLIKKLIPRALLSIYHRQVAILADFIYRHPSEKLIIIGVTGTNGKSTTSRLIADILKASGKKVGLTSTVEFEIAGRQWLNDKKMTMLGRLELQKIIFKMVKAGCEYAVIETSSEGTAQHRHLGINYDAVVFTNLTPEHIESHGGFENYKQAKGKLFKHLTSKPQKIIAGKKIPKISIINLDDKHASYFLQFKADKKYGYAIKTNYDIKGVFEIRADKIDATNKGSRFFVQEKSFFSPLIGEFNIYNSLAAIVTAVALGVDMPIIKIAVSKFQGVPGRLEFINAGQNFTVIIDQAPEPESLKQIYKTIQFVFPFHQKERKEKENFQFRRQESFPTPKPEREKSLSIIHVFGSCGGGRDKARRPILGDISAKNSDFIIITNEDPYDEDPQEIINEVAQGAINAGKELGKNLFKILDRRKAIKKALSLAKKDDLVLITGKGAEQAICVANGRKILWDDRTVVREEINKLIS